MGFVNLSTRFWMIVHVYVYAYGLYLWYNIIYYYTYYPEVKLKRENRLKGNKIIFVITTDSKLRKKRNLK